MKPQNIKYDVIYTIVQDGHIVEMPSNAIPITFITEERIGRDEFNNPVRIADKILVYLQKREES